MSLSDLDLTSGNRCLVAGEGIQLVDHPSFTDQEYVKRRKFIAEVSQNYKLCDKEIPRI